jgi:hypothetical protein
VKGDKRKKWKNKEAGSSLGRATLWRKESLMNL